MTTISVHPEVRADIERFSAERHRHLVVLEAPLRPVTGQASLGIAMTGWKLWCLNCDLEGQYVFTTTYEAKALADSLRSDDEPQCRHDQHAAGKRLPLLHWAGVEYLGNGVQRVTTPPRMRICLGGTLTREECIALLIADHPSFETECEIVEINPVTTASGAATEVVSVRRPKENP